MSISGKILRIDALLDQLDAFAAEKPSQVDFWSRWLSELRQVSGAESVALVLELGVHDPANQRSARESLGQCETVRASEQKASIVVVSKVRQEIFAAGTPTGSHPKSLVIFEGVDCCLVADLILPSSQSGEWTVAQQRIAGGFVEIGKRFQQQYEGKRLTIQRAANVFQLQARDILDEARLNQFIQEDLCHVLMASQVTLVEHVEGKSNWRGTTGLPATKKKSQAILELESRARNFAESEHPILVSRLSESRHEVLFRLEVARKSKTALRSASQTVIVQWTDADSMFSAMDVLAQLIPCLRKIKEDVDPANRNLGQASVLPFLARHPKKKSAIAILVLMLAAGWFSKDIKTTHAIDAAGLLVPANQRIIYSNCVGFVDQVYTEHEDLVEISQPLLDLRALDTEVQLEEIEGELAAVSQQLAGAKLSLNQAKSGSSETQAVTFQIASEIAALEAKVAGLIKQRELILKELASYKIASPIAGMVVTRDLEQNVLAKPVTPGEPLMRICDIEGPWVLDLDVDQRDIASVQRAFAEGKKGEKDGGEQNAVRVAFRLSSAPNQTYEGTLVDIDNVVTISREANLDAAAAQNSSVHVVRIRVEFDNSQLPKPQIDASVVAKIDCGKDFWWRNWSKQLVDAMRRRFWING